MAFDAVEAVETLYRTDLPPLAWLPAAMEALRPLIDPDRKGMFGGFYQCPDPLSFTPGPLRVLDVNDRGVSLFQELTAGMPEEFIADTLCKHGVWRAAAADGFARIPAVSMMKDFGTEDALELVALEPDGSGCVLISYHSGLAVLPTVQARLLQRVFLHFSAAHRLQLRFRDAPSSPGLADAVLDANGRLHDATGVAQETELGEALRAAVKRRESARGRRGRQEPIAALGAWETLVAGRWSLVDYFDHDGRRYILAVANSPAPAGFSLLSPRERAVVAATFQGSENKAIAYDLGISHSTVRVLLARAAKKLGAHTRRELLEKWKIARRPPRSS